MKVLVTGAGGFVGPYLIKSLLEHEYDVIALDSGNTLSVKQLPVPCFSVNIIDFDAVLKCMQQVYPDAVINLAAQSNVPKSWLQPAVTAEVNIVGSVNLLQALSLVNREGKFLSIGSGDEYGYASKEGVYLTEEMQCQPQNPYAVSKYCAGQLILQLGRKHGLSVIHARPFNHFGPGQTANFVIADFASQIAAIEKGLVKPVINAGNLNIYRDFTFVKDVVLAYVLLLEKSSGDGIYNICSGRARMVGDILNTLVSMSNTKIQVVVDQDKFRPSDVPYFVGDNSKLRESTGWSPKHDFYQGLQEVLNFWRQK